MSSQANQGTRIFAAIGWIVLVALVAASCDDGDGDFRALALEVDAPLARNERIVLRFTNPVDRETPVDALVRLRDDEGNEIAFDAELDGRHVILRPAEGRGWPEGSTLHVSIDPDRAVGFRSAEGRELAEPFRAAVAIGRTYEDFGTPMMIELEPTPNRSNVTRETYFEYRFSLPIDEECLHGPKPPVLVQVVLDGQSSAFSPDLHLSDDGRTLYVRPFSRRAPFVPNKEHVIRLHDRLLRAVTGRALERATETRFWTSPVGEEDGTVEFRFLREEPDDPSRPCWARPIATPADPIPVYEDRRGESGHTRPWSTEKARLQLFIPGDALGPEPGLVTGFSWFARLIPAAVFFPRIRLKVGYAAPHADWGLSERFADNYDAPAAFDPLDAPLDTVPRQATAAGYAVPTSGRDLWVPVMFEHSFVYEGGSRPLILEVINDQGCYALEPGARLPPRFRGIAWAGGPDERARLRSVLSESEGSPLGRPSPLVFATRIHIERYQDYVSPWEEADVPDPAWFRLASQRDLDATGRERRDFVFEFQGTRPNGSLTGWTGLESVAGCRKIRVKLRFLHDAERDLEERVEVRRLTVRYSKTAR